MLIKTHSATFLAALAIPLVIGMSAIAKQSLSSDTDINKGTRYTPEVSVASVSVANQLADIVGYGEVAAQFDVTVSAEVSGRIIHTEKAMESGRRVSAGELLMHIEDSEYRRAVSAAERAVAEAELASLQEERRGKQAEKEWQASGFDNEAKSELVLRKPQRLAAQAAHREALDRLTAAKLNLERTQVRAPFNGVIVERLVSPGNYVMPGSSLYRLVSSDRVEVRIPLSNRQWASVSNKPGTAVLLSSQDKRARWQGKVVRSEQHVGSNDRQRALVVAIDKPLEQTPALHTGTFVTVTIPTISIDKALQLPASALSAKGKIWYVDSANKLANYSPGLIYEFSSSIIVAPPEGRQSLRVLTRPLASYSSGLNVNPIEVEL